LEVMLMTTRAPILRAVFFLTCTALSSACESGDGGQAAPSGNVEVKAAAKADVTASQGTRADSTGAKVEARAVPGQAQLDVAAAQLAEANARLNDVGKAGASVEAKAQPGNPSLKVGTSSASVGANVEAGKPSLSIGKAGTLIDANVQAGKPSLNIGGLKPAASANTSASTQANTTKAGAGAKAQVSLGIGQ
jgi:hypothetical protein